MAQGPRQEPSPEQRRLDVLAAEIQRRGLHPPASVTKAKLAQEIGSRGLIVYKTFHEYIAASDQDLLKFEHVPKLVDVVDRLLRDELQNVMVMAPPRYQKSEVFSRRLPAYYLHRYPAHSFALSSHAAHLALELSEAAREYYVRAGGRLSPEASAKGRWQTAHADEKGRQGEMWAIGMGGVAIGRGFNLGGVDDPISPDHAFSHAFRAAFERWWEHTWLRAREPGAKMFFVMQRLGMDDPIDYLFQQELTRRALHWHVVCLDEVHSDEPLGIWTGPKGLPPACTLEPDWREVGQVLSPSRMNEAEVKERQRESTPYVVAAQRQQRPMRAEGDFWKKIWFEGKTYDDLPANVYNGGDDWDTAFGENKMNSATCVVRSFRGPSKPNQPDAFDVYIDDVEFRWVEFPQLIEWIQSRPGPHHIEEKASGKSAVQQLKAYGIKALEVPVKGDKLMRASSVQPYVSAGRVWVNSKVMEKLLWADQQGLLRITAEQLQQGGSTDVNDAFVQALHRHLGIHQAPRKQFRVV